jgi:lipopolysaccharide export system protein LptA
MKQNKIRKIIALSILIISVFVILIIISKKSKMNVREEKSILEGQSELHLVQTDGKREIFELFAKRHYPDKMGRFHLSGDVRIKIFRKAEGKDIMIKGDSGIYEKDLSLATIHNSEVMIEDLKIKSRELIYTSEGNIKSYSPSKFEHIYGSGEVDDFIYDLSKKTLLAHNFKGDFQKEENFHVSADKITISYNENSIFMEGRSFIKGEEYELKSEKIYSVFSKGMLVYIRGEGNSEILYYGRKEGKGVSEILGREGEKVLRCEIFEVKREKDLFFVKIKGNCKIEFPAKNRGERGSMGSQLIKVFYEKGKGLKEGWGEGGFSFIDSGQRIQAKNVYGKTDEEFKMWEVLKAEGDVKFEGDVSFECGNFSKNKGMILLEKGRPSVRRNSETVYADRIEYNSEKKIMKGEGNVKAFLGKKILSSSVPFFKGEEKIFAKGGHILWDENEEIINIWGSASLEQGEQFLKGDNLIFSKKKGYFSTKKDTKFLFIAKDERISGNCDSTEYSQEENSLILTGDAILKTNDYSIKGNLIKIGLDKEGEVDFIEGRSGVKFSSKEIEGEGEKFYLNLKNKKAIFEGNPSIKEEKRGKMKGRKIFIDLDKKEIKVEGNVSEVEIKEKR